MAPVKRLIFLLLVFVLGLSTTYAGTYYHPRGRLIEPPPRLSLWRHGYDTPKYTQDNELSCYIRKKKKRLNEKSQPPECGLCGETSLVAKSRQTEKDGEEIVRTYQIGQKIKVGVLLITPTVRRGRFRFELCSKCKPNEQETEKCFKSHVLKALSMSRVDPSRPIEARFAAASENIPRKEGSLSEEIDILAETDNGLYLIPADLPPDTVLVIELQLPADVSCNGCVLRWTYFAGKHRRLYGCADVSIIDRSNQSQNSQWLNPDCIPPSTQPGDEEIIIIRRRDQMQSNQSVFRISDSVSTTQLPASLSTQTDGMKEYKTTTAATANLNGYHSEIMSQIVSTSAYSFSQTLAKDELQRLHGLSLPLSQKMNSQRPDPNYTEAVQENFKNDFLLHRKNQLSSNRSDQNSSPGVIRLTENARKKRVRRRRNNRNDTTIAYQVICLYPYFFWEKLDDDGSMDKIMMTQSDENHTVSSGTDSTWTLTSVTVLVFKEPKRLTSRLRSMWPLQSLVILLSFSLMFLIFIDG